MKSKVQRVQVLEKMFLLYTFLLTINLYIGSTSTAAVSCKFNDGQCLEKFLYTVAEKIFTGEPSLNIEAADPLLFNRIDGNLQVLNYTLSDSTVTGLRQCKVKNIRVDVNVLTMRFDAECPPNAKIVGKYKVNGNFLSLPVEGHGDYNFLAGSFIIKVNADLEKLESKNNQIYLKVKNFKSTSEVTSPFKADFKNLFNGQKKLSDALHKFAHENWKVAADFVQEPLVTVVIKRLFINVNKLLKASPIAK